DYHAVPWAGFTEPAIAHVGLTGKEAEGRFAQLIVLRTPVDETSGFRVTSETDGFVKIIVDGETHQLTGAHLFCADADIIAQTLVLAIQQRMTCEQVRDMLYIFPGKSQVIQKALEN